MNITDVNNNSNVYKLSVKFLINLNSAELPSVIFKFKFRAFVILL